MQGGSWKFEIDTDRIAWLTCDTPGASTNVLSAAVLQELAATLSEIAQLEPLGVVVRSGKRSGFVAGADIKEFLDLRTPGEAYALIRSGQQVLDKLENLACPSVAAIQGFALGGGLELALDCFQIGFVVAASPPSVESGGRQGARRSSGTVGPPEGKAVQNLEFAVGFALLDQGQRVDMQRAGGDPKAEVPLEEARDAVGVRNGVGQSEMRVKLVQHIRIAPGMEIVSLTRRQAFRPSVFPVGFDKGSAQTIKTADHSGLERSQFFQRALGLQSHKRKPMASFNDAHPELASVKWRVLACELGDAVEQSGGVEVQAERKRRLQGRVKAVASRVAGHAPPGVRWVAFEREPFTGRASDGVAADHVAAETPEVAFWRRR